MLSTGVGRGSGGGRRQKWTAQQDARIREMAELKCSVAEVAAALGVTRNAVIGRAQRMDPRPQWALKPAPHRRGLPGSAEAVAITKRRGGRRRGRYNGPDMSEHQPAPAAAPPSLDVAVLDLREHHCRYPYGNRVPYLFCGAEPERGCSYCAFHRAMTCVPPARTPPFLSPTIAVT
jgi:hypothetical protein